MSDFDEWFAQKYEGKLGPPPIELSFREVAKMPGMLLGNYLLVGALAK